MVSIWWVMWAFLLGGFAGLLVFALMSMAGKNNDRAIRADEAVQHVHLGPMHIEKSWRT